MTDLATTIAEAVQRGLCDLQVRPCIGGWQAIAKHREREGGPWGVAVDADPINALRLALDRLPAVAKAAPTVDVFR